MRLLANVSWALLLTALTHAALPPRWTVSATPIFDVGDGPDSLHELYRVAGAIRLADGRVVVANAGTELRFYASDERYLKTVGRAGAGPGEFRGIFLLRRGAGDSILVYDGELSRLSVFSSDGEPGRRVSALRWGEVIVDHDAAGGFIAGPVYVSSAHTAPTVLRTTYAVQGISPKGTVTTEFATGLTKDSYLSRQPPRTEMGPMPFAAPVSVAVGRDLVYVAAGPEYYVSVFARDGSPRPPIRRAGSPHSVTDEDLDAYIENQTAKFKSERTRDVVRDRIERMPRADVVPEIANVLTDAADNLWVQDFAISSRSPSTWNVYSAEGRRIATVTLPPRVTLQQIGDDWLLGIQLDSDDVQHVVVYSLSK